MLFCHAGSKGVEGASPTQSYTLGHSPPLIANGFGRRGQEGVSESPGDRREGKPSLMTQNGGVGVGDWPQQQQYQQLMSQQALMDQIQHQMRIYQVNGKMIPSGFYDDE
jgi:hypothetical protein